MVDVIHQLISMINILIIGINISLMKKGILGLSWSYCASVEKI